jgi:hypothetical protein
VFSDLGTKREGFLATSTRYYLGQAYYGAQENGSSTRNALLSGAMVQAKIKI